MKLKRDFFFNLSPYSVKFVPEGSGIPYLE